MKQWTLITIIYMSVFFMLIEIVSAININNCGTLDVAGETYILTKNMSIDWTTCFVITAENVTLDCNGFSINGNDAVNNYSIYSTQANTTLKNCNISVLTLDKTKVIENDSKKALFDIIADIVKEPNNVGEDLIVKVSLINFGGSDAIDAHLKYTILDSNNIIVAQYIKSIQVKTQTEFLEYISTKNMKNEKYTLKIELTYAGQTFPASTEKVFYVGRVKGLFKKTNLKTFILPIIALALLIGVYKKSVINRLRKEKENNDNKSDVIIKDHSNNS